MVVSRREFHSLKYDTSAYYNWFLMESRQNSSSSEILPGYMPVSWYNDEIDKTEGDSLWKGRFPSWSSTTQTFTPQGVAEDEKTVEFYMPRWEKVSGGVDPDERMGVVGTYCDPDGINNDIVVGTPLFTDTYNHTCFPKSVEKTPWGTHQIIPGGYYDCYRLSEHFTYGDIYYAHANGLSAWVIGVYTSPNGWYKGEEPSKERDVTFTFQINPLEEKTLKLYQLFRISSLGTPLYPTVYDDSTQTFRMADKKVNIVVGWLECSAAELDVNLTFHFYNRITGGTYVQDETVETRVYNMLELLKLGENPFSESYSNMIYITTSSSARWQCNETEKLQKSLTFSPNQIAKPDKTIAYKYLISGNLQKELLLTEAAIWR